MVDNPLAIFASAWVGAQIASLFMLHLGSRLANHRYLLRLGQIAHEGKLRGVESLWPLTRVRPAAARGDTSTVTIILASLIGLKSLSCLVLGIVMIFWLPLASLVVPAIVTVHDPDDPALITWVQKVATLQVTSHTLAAAAGFTIAWVGPLDGAPVGAAAQSNAVLLAVACAMSLILAVSAGRVEAIGVVSRGI